MSSNADEKSGISAKSKIIIEHQKVFREDNKLEH